MSQSFKMTDMKEVDTFLGLQIKRKDRGYGIFQTHYINKVLSKYKMKDGKEQNSQWQPPPI